MKKLSPQSKDRILFNVKSRLGALVSTTNVYWRIITNVKHPSVKGKEHQVQETLLNPHEIRRSKKDPNVQLFYRRYRPFYLCVVTRIEKTRGFIVTVYYTKKIKQGDLVWKQ